MNNVALIYTYFGWDNYERFLESYTKHPAGYPHDFFPMIPDEGMNVGVYLKAAERLDHDFLCCCTAYTEFLTDNWLQKMMNEAVRLNVGAVDVMGSFRAVLNGDMMDQMLPMILPLFLIPIFVLFVCFCAVSCFLAFLP